MSCCGPATASENSSLRSTSPLLEGLHENIKLLVGNTRSSGMPALYAYSSCSASIKRRNGIATSHRELFHNRGGRLLLISNHLEPTPGSTISRHVIDLLRPDCSRITSNGSIGLGPRISPASFA
jgi:hypothetical protein